MLIQRNAILNGADNESTQLDLSSTCPSVCENDRFENLLEALFMVRAFRENLTRRYFIPEESDRLDKAEPSFHLTHRPV